MSFAPIDGEGPKGVGHVSKQQPKQGRDEGSPFERSIKASIQEMQESMRAASEQLDNVRRGFISKRTEESLEKFLERSRELAQDTEILFRDWTLAMADEPSERRRKRFSYEKLQKAFEQEVAHLKEIARQAVAVQQETAEGAGTAANLAVECRPVCEDQCPDEERGLLDDTDSANNFHISETATVNIHSQIAQEREDGIRRIQNQVAEVNQIFRDLASIVTEQGQQFETIEQQAEVASASTKDATRELRKTLDRQRSQRERLCCMLIAGVLLLCIVVLPHTTGGAEP